MLLTDGEYYEGLFKNGLRHGLGVYIFKSGNKYKGSWENGTKSGKGVFEF